MNLSFKNKKRKAIKAPSMATITLTSSYKVDYVPESCLKKEVVWLIS